MLAYGMVIALGLVMRSMCVDGFKASFFNIDIARGLISFFIGLELALVIKRHPRIVNAASIVAAITAICLFVAFYATDRDGLVGSETSQYYALVFLVYPSVIVICKAPILTRLFSSERLSFVGGCAYNMYVLSIAASSGGDSAMRQCANPLAIGARLRRQSGWESFCSQPFFELSVARLPRSSR